MEIIINNTTFKIGNCAGKGYVPRPSVLYYGRVDTTYFTLVEWSIEKSRDDGSDAGRNVPHTRVYKIEKFT